MGGGKRGSRDSEVGEEMKGGVIEESPEWAGCVFLHVGMSDELWLFPTTVDCVGKGRGMRSDISSRSRRAIGP